MSLSQQDSSARRARPRAAVVTAVCLCVAAGSALPAIAAGQDGSVGPRRGTLVSAVHLAGLDAAQATAYVRDQGFAAPAAQDGVDVYRITYRTVGATGRPALASGVVTLPRKAAGHSRAGLRTVEYNHGTLPYRGDAGSVSDGADRAVTVMFAGAGFAAVAPDYLGLGVGTGLHPYMDIDSETTASVDMLKAARTFEAGKGVSLDGKVMVTGFSQGGAASMGIGRALQQGAAPGLRLAALAPVSGPYDLRDDEIPAAFDGRLAPPIAAFYLAYAITSWNRLHPLYHSPAEAFRTPYAATVEGLFDGTHTDEEIVAGLPGTPEELLTPQFIAQMKHPTGALAEIMRADDAVCTDWAPQAPVRLYDGRLDTDVAPANTRSCQDGLAANGVHAPIVSAGQVDHMTSARVSYPRILQWFRQLTAQH
jgi:hypothetical protein